MRETARRSPWVIRVGAVLAATATTAAPGAGSVEALFARVPSAVAGETGIPVQIDVPRAARYADAGAPIAVYVTGGFRGEGIGDKTGKLIEQGFIEVRFNFPGSGSGQLKAGGAYDYRGKSSLQALRDVLRFVSGVSRDAAGRTIADVTRPIEPMTDNVGVIGWSYGGVTAICAAGKYGKRVPGLAWIVSWEAPVGDGMPTAEAGAVASSLRPGNPMRNPAYDPDTGRWDLASLAYDAAIRIPVVDTSRSVYGGLYFDLDGNGRRDAGADFVPYPLVFEIGGRLQAFYSERIMKAANDAGLIPAQGPAHLISLKATRSFWRPRNGERWIRRAARRNRGLMFLVVASEQDHVQTAPDHPHVLLQYDGFLATSARVVRVNPDRAYVEDVLGASANKAVDNPAFTRFDHQSIRDAVEPGGSRTVFGKALVPAAACELADRTQYDDLRPQLGAVLARY